MHHDKDMGRDWLELLPRAAWPEPWHSMDTGAPPLRPDNIGDPEALHPPRAPVPAPGVLYAIDWVSGTPRWLLAAYARWRAAIVGAADTGDAAPLVDLLLSDELLHRDARDLLAELLAVRRLSRTRGGQAMPGRVSLAQGTLRVQAKGYRYYRGRGLKHDEALRQAIVAFKAEEVGGKLSGDEIAESVSDAEVERLHAHIRGKHGPSRRAKKRRRGRERICRP